MQESTKNGVWNMIRKTSVFYDDDWDEEERNGQWENKSNNKNAFSFPKKHTKKLKISYLMETKFLLLSVLENYFSCRILFHY